jgi:hypothetical protein
MWDSRTPHPPAPVGHRWKIDRSFENSGNITGIKGKIVGNGKQAFAPDFQDFKSYIDDLLDGWVAAGPRFGSALEPRTRSKSFLFFN